MIRARILYAIIITIISMSAVSGQGQTDQAESVATTGEAAKPDTLMYTVYGMDCPGCEGGLEKQVNKIPSVKSSNANWKRQELAVIVRKDSVLNIEELNRRVKKANFTLVTDD